MGRDTYLKMSQLPRTRSNDYRNLSKAVPDSTRVRGLAEIPVVRLALSLVLLLAPYILELLVEVTEFGRELGDVRPVLLAVVLCVADDEVEVQPDVRVDGGCGETDGVVPSLLRRKRELAVCGAPRPDNVVAGVDVLRNGGTGESWKCKRATMARTTTTTRMDKSELSTYFCSCSDHWSAL